VTHIDRLENQRFPSLGDRKVSLLVIDPIRTKPRRSVRLVRVERITATVGRTIHLGVGTRKRAAGRTAPRSGFRATGKCSKAAAVEFTRSRGHVRDRGRRQTTLNAQNEV
jgi:hypothetical protein